MEPVTGVAVPILVPPEIQAIRERWDYAAGLGAGAHVTVLFPFLPVSALDDGVRAALSDIATLVEPLEVRFEGIRRFEGLVWIEPDDPTPFQTLTAAVTARWPAFPPYEGLFDTVIHHLTIAESETGPLEAIEAEARAYGPFVAAADRLELWVEATTGRWTPLWAMPLGVRR
jgi:2'-5' RNA ligase superfamily